MQSEFSTVFDLTRSPDRIQPEYWFYGIFIFAAVVLLLLTAAAWRWRWRKRWFLSLFTSLWIVLLPYTIWDDFREVAETRRAVEQGAFKTVEGCLEYFRPGDPYGSKSTSGNEEWRVAGNVFSYGQGQVRPGYHLVSARGGEVSADSRVRVTFVTSRKDGRLQIIRLVVEKHGCPAARLVEAHKQP